MTAADTSTRPGTFAVEQGNLHDLLKAAMTVELTTIPAYLQAMFSLEDRDDGGANREALETIRSVLVEEMLHLTLAANLLNAVGGEPALDRAEWVPSYPCNLFPKKKVLGAHVFDPDTGVRKTITRVFDLSVSLRRFSPDQVSLFETIEAHHEANAGVYAADLESIGQFYMMVAKHLEWMVETFGMDAVFCGDPARQVGPEYYYAGGGALSRIDPAAGCPLEQATAAIRLITEEGEGADAHGVFDGQAAPGLPGEDVAHVFKFREILHECRYGPGADPRDPPSGAPMPVNWDAVWPAIDDPNPDDPSLPPDVAEAMRAFDRRYADLLRQINRGYRGEPHLLRDAVHGMFELKYAGVALMRTPLGDGRTAAPAWRFVEA